VARVLERLFFWLGVPLVVLPTYLRVAFLAVETVMGVGIYDSAIGADPFLHPRGLPIASVWLLFGFAQIASLGVRKTTLGGHDKWLRSLLAHAGLIWACLSALFLRFPELVPDLVPLVAAGLSLPLFIGAIAARRSPPPVVVLNPPPD
jgi:hypothetical protein